MLFKVIITIALLAAPVKALTESGFLSEPCVSEQNYSDIVEEVSMISDGNTED